MKPIHSLAGAWGFIGRPSASSFADYSLKDCRLTAVNTGYQDQRSYTQTLGFMNNIFQRCKLTFYQNSNPYQASLFNNLLVGGSLTINLSWQTWNWTVADNLFDAVTLSTAGVTSSNSYNAFYQTTAFPHQGGVNVTLTNLDFQAGPLGNYYYPASGTNLARLIDAGSRTAAAAGLAGYTTQTNQTPDTGTVDIGFHYRDFAIRPGFNQNILAPNDDDYTGTGTSGTLLTNLLANIGFSINFFGTAYTNLYVNNNGNVTFDTYLSAYTPTPLVNL